jgi:hypothetical protein
VRKAQAAFLIWLVILITGNAALADRQVTLTLLGDCTIGCEERLMGKDYSFAKVAESKGYAYFFEKVLPLLSQDDLTIANFEGVLKETTGPRVNKTYCFRGLPAYAQIMKLGSVEAVSLANNHSSDYGIRAYNTTWTSLVDAGVQPVDLKRPYVADIGGIKIGVVAIYAAGYFAKRDIMRDAVQRARDAGADAVVCMIHSGQEYDGLHSRNQMLVAHLLIDAGADVVVSSHPHVLQGMEVYKQRNILYSVGNFVFGGNASVRSNETVVSRFTLTFTDEGVYQGQQMRLYAAHISGEAVANNYQPVLVSGDAADAVWQQIDADSAGQPSPETQTDAYREYAYLQAEQPVDAQ